MKEKTYFFSGIQKKTKLLAASLLCVGHASLLLADPPTKHNMETALLQIAEPLKRSADASAEKTFYVVTDENNREVGLLEQSGVIDYVENVRHLFDKYAKQNKHRAACSAATRHYEDETNVALTLTDYKAEGSDGGDQVYAYQPMKEKLPRGLATTKDPSGTLLHQLCGLRKFDYDWSYVTQPQIQSAKEIKLYAMEKENGSTAHIGAFIKKEQLFWVIGCKNSHRIISDKTFQAITQDTWENAASYKFGPQGDYAQNIIYLWRQVWNNLQPNNQKAIKEQMTTDGITFIGEAVFKDDQHLRRYFEDEHPSQGDIWFFAMTQPASLEEGLIIDKPDTGINLFAQYGLQGAPIHQVLELKPEDFDFTKGQMNIKPETYKVLVDEITRKENSEGAALYMTLVDENGVEKTVDLTKCKAAPYTLMRMIRERFLSAANNMQKCSESFARELDKTIKQSQTSITAPKELANLFKGFQGELNALFEKNSQKPDAFFAELAAVEQTVLTPQKTLKTLMENVQKCEKTLRTTDNDTLDPVVVHDRIQAALAQLSKQLAQSTELSLNPQVLLAKLKAQAEQLEPTVKQEIKAFEEKLLKLCEKDQAAKVEEWRQALQTTIQTHQKTLEEDYKKCSLDADAVVRRLEGRIEDFKPEQKPALEDVIKDKKEFYQNLAHFFKKSGILSLHKSSQNDAQSPANEMEALKSQLKEAPDPAKKQQLATRLAELNKKTKSSDKNNPKRLETRKEAIRSQWVSIEEQLKDPNKKHVKLKVGEEELSFPKPSTTQ